MSPTIAQPWTVNGDGTVDVLVWQGRVFTAAITHSGLVDPSGYTARVGFAAVFGGDLLMSGSTADGRVTLQQLPDDAGTLITVALPDEVTDLVTVRRGFWDLVLESPGGVESTVLAGAFTVRAKVTS